MRFVYILTLSCLIGFASTVLSAEKSTLVRVYPKRTDAAPIVGELRKESDTEIEVFDLRRLAVVRIGNDLIRKIERDLSGDAAGAVVGLPNMVAWKVRDAFSLTPAAGKIASIQDFNIFVNVGSSDGVQVADELVVYRKAQAIRDPDTGEVLDEQRKLIARLRVVETRDRVSKCKLNGEFDVDLEIGDEIESKTKPAIAVFPFAAADGGVTENSIGIAEHLASGLVELGIPLVERTLLEQALTELAIQQTALFDPENVSKVGRLVGAKAIVVGRMTEIQRTPAINLRLVKVDTGEILFSHVQRIRDSGGKPDGTSRIPTSQIQIVKTASVLDKIELARDTRQGSWTWRDKKLVHSGGDRQDSILRVPVESSQELTFSLSATLEGPLRDVTCIALYVILEDGEFIAQIAKDGSCIIVDSNDPRSKGAAKYGEVFEEGKSVDLSARITTGKLTVFVNGKEFLSSQDRRLGRSKVVGLQVGMLGAWTIESIGVSSQK